MFTNLAQEEENFVNTCMYQYSINSLINYVYEFGSGRGNFVNTQMYLYSMNSLINYVYEFGSGRGKFRKSPLISS